MPAVKQRQLPEPEQRSQTIAICYHCGSRCITGTITADNHVFCCDGCRLVYEILNSNGLCDYYKLQDHPGLSQIKTLRKEKYAYLDNDTVANTLYKFTDGDHTVVTLYIPGIHCSSCMWLLEHLHRINKDISESRLNFTNKEVTIHFKKSKISLRGVVELLATIGYEPYISLNDADEKKVAGFNKQRLYRLGVAGFCFGNIMMMSFPEYLAAHTGIEQTYAHLFRYLNFMLALPVFFYCSSEFFTNALNGIKQKMLNIDFPIALSIVITFVRSMVEIAGNTGAGYLDSMSGIVFFMLVGRAVQERTYKSITFNRDYKSYFPIAVNVATEGGSENRMLSSLKEGDEVLLHYDEIIPADGILMGGQARVDYSFVSGESAPVTVNKGETVYAGGRQTAGGIRVKIIKPVAGSYLTSLWNHYSFKTDKAQEHDANSAINVLSRYFTWILLALALVTAIYWLIYNPVQVMPSVTAMLIVACPCALLLSATFTNGNIMRILSNNGLFVRDATVIEQLANFTHIVFDKTGTLTRADAGQVTPEGHQLTEDEKNMLYNAVASSKHPISKALASWLGRRSQLPVSNWVETAGNGISAMVSEAEIRVGSRAFVGLRDNDETIEKAAVYVKLNTNFTVFHTQPVFRDAIPGVISRLGKQYCLSLISGDHDGQRAEVRALFGKDSELLFEQKPIDKLHYIEDLQLKGGRVMMIGDGLNDAGALQQSNVGITLADDINNFTPSCDAILDAAKLPLFPAVLKLAKASKYLINAGFSVSIVYNLVGLAYAMQGRLSPVMAAILMPSSTLTIVLIAAGVSSIAAKAYGLSLKSSD